MNKKYYIYSSIFFLGFFTILFSCGNSNSDTKEITSTHESNTLPPSFNIGVQALSVSNKLPYLQSFVFAQQGSKVLLIGGRISGFHNRISVNGFFNNYQSNHSMFVIDFSNNTYSEMVLDSNDASNLQFFSTNMEYCQSGDNLYLCGGFGQQQNTSKCSNYTFDRIVSISVSKMIAEVEKGKNGNVKNGILGTANSPFVQVTGGELCFQNNTFYLMFGQNFNKAYSPGVNGIYTSAVRKFNFNGTQITDTSSIINPILHRRDLPVAAITQKAGIFYAGFGGVFNVNDGGYVNPAYINVNGNINITQDTLTQITNQYSCASANIYDAASDANFTILMGGIGANQYNEKTHKWENGDGSVPLPFVNSITQMIAHNGTMTQYVQTPPNPTMPGLIGANAVFIPDANLMYNEYAIDYSKITSDKMRIGLMYGGIRSIHATSGLDYPTSLNDTIYEVYIYKNSVSKK